MLDNLNLIQNKKEEVTPEEDVRGGEDIYEENDVSNSEISICIPRVFKNITIHFITDIFQNKLKLGIIKRVDVILNHNLNHNLNNQLNNQFKKVFIHFESWYDNKNAVSVKNKLSQGLTIKIVYNSPWFWKCVLNNNIIKDKE